MLPEAFLNEIKNIIPDEYEAFLNSYNEPVRRALRINTLKPEAFAAAERYSAGRVDWEDAGRYIIEGTRPGTSVYHAAGAFYLQDASAMAPVNVLNPQKDEVILDMCAAPGGKSGQIAARLAGTGALVANEYVQSRARILKSNLERLGVTNARVTNTSPDKIGAACPEVFDAVLVDAPCSGEGMFRRDPDAVNEWTPDSPAACAERQAYVLDGAAAALKPGGRMVYSTCTFNRAENEGSVEAFLSRHPEFHAEEFSLPGAGRSVNGCLRLWPHRITGEGHFMCLFRKDGEAGRTGRVCPKTDKLTLNAVKQLETDAGIKLPEGRYSLINGSLFYEPYLMPETPGIYTLGSGLLLGEINAKFAEPSYALAMAMTSRQAPRAELSEEEAIRYLQGEAIETNGRGWTLACFEGLPLGWGKISGGILKNHLPKGLRLRGGHSAVAAEEA